MNRAVSVVLLVAGIAMLVFGFQQSNSFSSDVSRAFTGSPTDKAMWLLIGGGVAAVLGLFGLLRGAK